MSVKTYIAYSGGVESTTMLMLFGHEATPLFSDTGWEHQALYDWLNTVEKKTHVKIERVKREGETLPEYIRRSKFYPSQMARFCTRMFKIEPMDDYLKSRVPCELMIGFNYDERERTGNHGLIDGVTYSYPLIDLKINRDTCIAALKQKGLMPTFPGFMRRGGCIGCFYKSPKEYYRMAKESPQEAYSIADLEDDLQDDRKTHYAVRDGIPNMRRFLDNARAQMEMPLNDEQDYTTSPCGVFCHR